EYFLTAGHCPHDEIPEQVNSHLREWVTSLS
ncbi:MAG: alpha/beta hydrolase, partial [Aphanizomenon sp.]